MLKLAKAENDALVKDAILRAKLHVRTRLADERVSVSVCVRLCLCVCVSVCV